MEHACPRPMYRSVALSSNYLLHTYARKRCKFCVTASGAIALREASELIDLAIRGRACKFDVTFGERIGRSDTMAPPT
jgi:hypothetical protein